MSIPLYWLFTPISNVDKLNVSLIFFNAMFSNNSPVVQPVFAMMVGTNIFPALRFIFFTS